MSEAGSSLVSPISLKLKSVLKSRWDMVIAVTGSAVDIANPLATTLSQAGAHVYICQPFLSDNDVPGDHEYPGQTFINMDENNKMSIANTVRLVESRVSKH